MLGLVVMMIAVSLAMMLSATMSWLAMMSWLTIVLVMVARLVLCRSVVWALRLTTRSVDWFVGRLADVF